MSTEADLQIEFAQKVLCDNRINHDQYNYIISNLPDLDRKDLSTSVGMTERGPVGMTERGPVGMTERGPVGMTERGPVDAIADLGLTNEYRNFKTQIERNNQDADYQISMINDLLNETKKSLAQFKTEHLKVASEYESKEKAYETVKGRFTKFPDNPRFIQEMNDAEKDFTPLRNSYLHNLHIIKEYQDSINLWEKQIADLS
jgi:hypothetical protein